ncbi:MAG: hypothetical protein USCGTAYLOR_01301 [Chromatiales bacterium USCg_Taylor]|nr:MAG: hypothetical protein USCGTAYLOR_01301 [Chromatiales bacterium USCg_Taylor]
MLRKVRWFVFFSIFPTSREVTELYSDLMGWSPLGKTAGIRCLPDGPMGLNNRDPPAAHRGRGRVLHCS